MKIKNIEINSYDEIDSKTWLSLNKSCNSYNGIKFYLVHDKENPKIKNVIYTFNEDNKISKENKGKTMKQSEFQELVINEFKEQKKFKEFVINEFKEQKKFNEQQIKFNEFVTQQFAEQKKFNELFSKRLDSIENRLDSIEYRLTRLESFHEKDIKNYESKEKNR